MQGVLFVAIHQHLRELGDEELRRQCFPEPGAYLAFRDYPETDLLHIARCVADRLPGMAQPLGEVLRSLGEEVPAALRRTNPSLLPRAANVQELLALLEGEGSARVVLPQLRVLEGDEGRVSLLHLGDPSVCRFDEGLLLGLAALTGERLTTRHPSCRQRKDDRCVFLPRVVLGEAPRGRTSMTLRLGAQDTSDKDDA